MSSSDDEVLYEKSLTQKEKEYRKRNAQMDKKKAEYLREAAALESELAARRLVAAADDVAPYSDDVNEGEVESERGRPEPPSHMTSQYGAPTRNATSAGATALGPSPTRPDTGRTAPPASSGGGGGGGGGGSGVGGAPSRPAIRPASGPARGAGTGPQPLRGGRTVSATAIARSALVDARSALAGIPAPPPPTHMHPVDQLEANMPLTHPSLPPEIDDINPAHAVRLLKAKVIALEDTLKEVRDDLSKKESEASETSKSVKELAEENASLKRKAVAMKTATEKAKKVAADEQQKRETAEATLRDVRKELDQVSRGMRTADSDVAAREARVNRALEDLEKCKQQLRDAKMSDKENQDNARKAYDLLKAENRKLERQKQEVISAYKKQLKLIDILQRQKVLIEAAKMLSFTEDEFSKVLELGS